MRWLFLILLITFLFGIEAGMFSIIYMIYQITITKTWDFAVEFAQYTKYADLACTIAPGVVAGFFTVALVVRHFGRGGKKDVFNPLIPSLPDSIACVLTLLIIYIVTGFVVAGYAKGVGKWFDETIIKPIQDIFESIFHGLAVAIKLTTDISLGIGSLIALITFILLVPHISRTVDRLPYPFFTSAVIAVLITLPITIPAAIACSEIVKLFYGMSTPWFFKFLTLVILALAVAYDIRKMTTKSDLALYLAPVFTIGCQVVKYLAMKQYYVFVDIFVIAVMLLIGVYVVVSSLAILADRKALFTRLSIGIASIAFTPIVTGT